MNRASGKRKGEGSVFRTQVAAGLIRSEGTAGAMISVDSDMRPQLQAAGQGGVSSSASPAAPARAQCGVDSGAAVSFGLKSFCSISDIQVLLLNAPPR
jgi:hypothetical protein